MDTKHSTGAAVWQPIPTYIVDNKGDFASAAAVFASGFFHVIRFVPKAQENWLQETLQDFKEKYPAGSNHVIISCTDRIRSKYPVERVSNAIRELITSTTNQQMPSQRWDIAYLYTAQGDCEVPQYTDIHWETMNKNTGTPLVFLFTPQMVQHFGTYKPTIMVARPNLMNLEVSDGEWVEGKCKTRAPNTERVPVAKENLPPGAMTQAITGFLLPRLIIATLIAAVLYYTYTQGIIPFTWLIALSVVMVLIVFLL